MRAMSFEGESAVARKGALVRVLARLPPRAGALLLTLCSACMAQLPGLSVGHVGCPKREIEVSEVQKTGVGVPVSWVATCRGVRHLCAVQGVGSQSTVECARELPPVDSQAVVQPTQ